MVDERLPYVVGFQSNRIDGNGWLWNFILSNGEKTKRSDGGEYTTHMIPENLPKIRKVMIFHDWCVNGFSFFDKSNCLIWEIGARKSHYKVEEHKIDENE